MDVRIRILAAVIGALVCSAEALAHSHQKKGAMQGHHGGDGIKIEQAWARATPGIVKTAAAYIAIRNAGKRTDRLVAVASDVAKRVEIHTHRNENGVMRMRRIHGLNVLAGDRVILKPGGTHLMLFGLHQPLKKGQTFQVILSFRTAGEVKSPVKVMSVGALQGEMDHKTKHGHVPHRGHQ